MREKGRLRKESKILVRVNRDEKLLAEELSKKAGMNTSEYIRNLIKEAKENAHLNLHLKIVDKYEKVLSDYRTLLSETKKKRIG